MTAFDAAVFDLVRVALRRRFFDLIGKFGKQEKVTVDWIGSCGSFETVRDRMIEDQLKRRYVKDLLSLLHGMGVQCVKEGEQFVRLIELILRRNLHVHNRGVVDERYLEREQGAKPKFNLDNLKVGDVAQIDSQYFHTADQLCGGCIELLARWAEP
jgi:hypothetical protein